MPPIVAKVVDVHHRLAFGQKQFGNRHYTFVNDLDITAKSIIIRHAPILAVLLKLVKVAVRPAEDRLESVVEAAQRHRARNLDSSPSGRFNFEQCDLQSVDGGLRLGGGHKEYCRPRRTPAAPSANCRPGYSLDRPVLASGLLQSAPCRYPSPPGVEASHGDDNDGNTGVLNRFGGKWCFEHSGTPRGCQVRLVRNSINAATF